MECVFKYNNKIQGLVQLYIQLVQVLVIQSLAKFYRTPLHPLY